MPTYNSEATVKNSIISALRQTIPEKEIICIDDGSVDGTMGILRKMSNQYSEVRVIQQIHRGSGPARNLGIKSAKAKYVAFLDSDDEYVESDALESMVNACIKKGALICGSNRIVSEDGIDRDAGLFREFNIKDEGAYIDFADYQDDYHYHSFIFERTFLIDNDIAFPPLMRYQDPPFFLKAMSVSKKFYVLPCVLYRYRQSNRASIINENIDGILEGVLQTIKLASEGGYEKLLEKIRFRLDEYYREAIMMNLSDKIMSLIIEINNVLMENGIAKPMITEQIYEDTKNMPNVWKSNHYLELIIEINHGEKLWERYLNSMEVRSVVIYGVGKFGKILINEMVRSGIDIVCCIDKVEDAYQGIPVIKPYEDIPKCDLLIVSLLYPDAVLKDLSSGYGGSIKTFTEIIDDMHSAFF